MNYDRIRSEVKYRVLMSRDAHFSIWPASRHVPVGWRDTGMAGSELECGAYLKSIRTTRPLGFRGGRAQIREA